MATSKVADSANFFQFYFLYDFFKLLRQPTTATSCEDGESKLKLKNNNFNKTYWNVAKFCIKDLISFLYLSELLQKIVFVFNKLKSPSLSFPCLWCSTGQLSRLRLRRDRVQIMLKWAYSYFRKRETKMWLITELWLDAASRHVNSWNQSEFIISELSSYSSLQFVFWH